MRVSTVCKTHVHEEPLQHDHKTLQTNHLIPLCQRTAVVSVSQTPAPTQFVSVLSLHEHPTNCNSTVLTAAAHAAGWENIYWHRTMSVKHVWITNSDRL